MTGSRYVDGESVQSPVISDDVRDSMNRLPRFFALPLTMLTGKPHCGQRPIRFTPTGHLVNGCISMIAGVVLTVAGMTTGGWGLLLLVLGWAMTLHGMRNLRMMIYHQCAHRNMWRHQRLDAVVGKCLAGLLVVQNFERYCAEHVSDHHALHHMTLRDPTVQAFLVGLRLRPGMSRRKMWRTVLTSLVSPVFHARFLYARVRSYRYGASRVELVGVLTAHATVVGLVYWWDAWWYYLVAWLLPLTVFFQVSNTLRLCVKHTFPQPEERVRRGKVYFAGLTNAIFMGERAPAPGLSRTRSVLAWTRWWLRMLCVHFPGRYLVLTGDTVCHDFHHRHPMSKDWANYIFEREQDAANGQSGWPPYRNIWGLIPAIDAVFSSLSTADREIYDRELLAAVNHREVFAAFDD